MLVTLRSEVNPDHNFSYNREIPQENVEVENLEEAQQVCAEYIERTDIGGGNWAGGEVWDDGVQIAYISYNCRVWTPEKDSSKRTLILERK
jgi:hypothetical protein